MKKKEKIENESGNAIIAGNGEAIVPEKPDGFLLVGIGASAGGIQALKVFFENVPPDSGIGYVVILHLSPDHDSKLAEVLQAATNMPVRQVLENLKVEPDHVYVVPPNQHLIMLDGHLGVSQNVTAEERRAPVDIFFRTLADSHGSRAVAVVLSGTGANGSMGLKRVKEHGGAAFVQNPREAEFNEMPRNSIATDLVDEVLPVAQIPGKIIAYRDSLGKIDIPLDAEARPEEQQQALREIFTQLRVQTGHDFSNYKRPTLLRRIARRINVRDLPDLPSYAALIRDSRDEGQALMKDLLISVTNFFRDKEPFSFLVSDVIPRIFAGKTANDQVRIWSVGTATGEEAYSLAMLCAEHTLDLIDSPKVQIFATDIDEAALAGARDGIYTINDAADVSPERLRRFFAKEGDEYRVRREIREMVLFANHNVIKDPPFSRLNLASCRNLLIYLNHPAKERVMETLHFALEPGGYLLLGTSESVDGATDLYAPFSRENHIYQARQTGSRPYPVPEAIPSFRFDRTPVLSRRREKLALERITYGDLHQQLLERYAPPSVVVNEEYDIVHLSERAGRYLQVLGGDASNNLLKMALPDLRLELRSALFQAVQRKTNVEARNLKVTVDGKTETLNVHVRPVLGREDTARGFLLVVFEESSGDTHTVVEEPLFRSDERLARQLDEELSRSKAQLRASSEQYEIQAEELKASNEELQAMNEELRSAAEELETSKEELQSINEELRTVNQELKVKIEETTIASNNLHNLINSTDIGTIFLDRSLRVKLFSPASRQLFNLIPADYGRPLSDITNRLVYDDLVEDAENVMGTRQTVEREINSDDKRSFLMRIVPYRTAEDKINGVVLTYLEITQRKAAEAELKNTEERMRMIVESAKDYAIFTTDMERRINSWSSGAEGMFGYSDAEIVGQCADILFVPEDRLDGAPAREAEIAFKEGRAENERWHSQRDESRFYGSGVVMPLRDDNGKAMGLVKIIRDLTKEKRAQDELERFNRAAVGRETRMIELKQQVNDLHERLGEDAAYPLDFEKENLET